MKHYAPMDAAFSVNKTFLTETQQEETAKRTNTLIPVPVWILSWILFLTGAAVSVMRSYCPGNIW